MIHYIHVGGVQQQEKQLLIFNFPFTIVGESVIMIDEKLLTSRNFFHTQFDLVDYLSISTSFANRTINFGIFFFFTRDGKIKAFILIKVHYQVNYFAIIAYSLSPYILYIPICLVI